MFCPACGNQNFDTAKFCRACGIDLVTVSLALSNKLTAPSNWLELYGDSKSNVITGAVMTGAAFLIFIIPFLISWRMMPWAGIWTVFFGWLAVWGILKIAYNAGDLVKAKTMLKAQGSFNPELPSGEQLSLPQTPPNYQMPNYRYDTDQLQSPGSVTDRTTQFLDKK